MSMSDPIADMLTRIRNAYAVNKKTVLIPSSKLKIEISKLLLNEGYITNFNVTDDIKKDLMIELKYFEGRPVISTIKRISKPGLRKYYKKEKLIKVMGGLGIAIVSTSKGLMTDKDARKHGYGGEILCVIS